jgi:NADH-quinone oxidoreductase subunit F
MSFAGVINGELLAKEAKAYQAAAAGAERRLIICAGTGCVAGGALDVYGEFVRAIDAAGIDVVTELRPETPPLPGFVHVSRSGCQGFCQMGPLATILPDGILYTRVRKGDVVEIVESTLKQGQPVERLLYLDKKSKKTCRGIAEIPFYRAQQRFVLKECGVIDPDSLPEYLAHEGYQAACRAYTHMTPQEVCVEIDRAGLRGRGGGGFPTGRKWELARVQPGETKYVICNGDEGDPGAFMDRSVMEGNPHSVIEGLLIASRAIGASEAYVYVRAEYPLAVRRVRKAVEDATKAGLLGKNLFGTHASLEITVMEGAGAFVCGEETALIASIEGKRGMPAPKPPFPAQSGLWGKPTVINNVETLASVPRIVRMGADQFRAMGSKTSPGTKTFALTGHVVNTGLIEVAFGATLREIVYGVGGGVTSDDGSAPSEMKAVQIGGPSGGCLTPQHLDLQLDFDSLRGIGAMVGSGGLVVMNKDTCMVSMARFFMQFTQNESCGKCVLCREGTKQLLALLDDIIDGKATLETLDLLEQLARTVQKGSLCGLGKTAPNPVLAMTRLFRDEYLAHVVDKRCPAGRCKALLRPHIIPAKCKGCGVCLKVCAVNAISGEKRQVHAINETLCTRCGACAKACRLGAIALAGAGAAREGQGAAGRSPSRTSTANQGV